MELSLSLSLTGRLLSSAFSPALLFALAEPGVWYDPSDLTTLFQDTAGTTPVTTPGQTVALALDKSKGLVLGSELVAAGWTLDTGWAQSDRTFTAVSVASNTEAERSSIVTPGKSYQITVNWSGLSAASIWRIYLLQFTTALDIGATADGASGSKTVIATAPSSGTITALRALNNSQSGVFTLSIKELPGFHATQATLASRPTYGIVPLGGRRNRLLSTNDLSSASWLRLSVSSVSAAASPDTNSAWTVTTSGTDGAILQSDASASGTVKTHHVRVKAGTSSTFRFQETVAFNGVYVDFNLNAITAGSPVTAGTGGATISSATIVDEGDGWRLCTITATRTSGTGGNFFLVVVGASGSTMTFRMPQAEAGSTATAYQRVGSAFDVTEAGVASLSYLSFDGVDDSLVTPTITPGIDRAQVFAGVRFDLGNSSGTLLETSTGADANNGAFFLRQRAGGVDQFQWTFRSTTTAAPTFSYTLPEVSVLTATSDFSAPLTVTRRNGVQRTAIAAPAAGTTNFLAYPLYIGRRAGTSLPFNGQLFSLIVRFGTNLDAGTITSTETWVGGKTGITI